MAKTINKQNTNVESKQSAKQQFELFEKQINYFHNLIQKTIISIQKYKQFDIIGPNE